MNGGSYVHFKELDKKESSCIHCVVGHLLLTGGMPVAKLEILDDLAVSPFGAYEIGYILTSVDDNNGNFVRDTLATLGFFVNNEYKDDTDKLQKLQYINDNNLVDRSGKLIEFIEKWITEEEQKEGVENKHDSNDVSDTGDSRQD